MKKLLIAGVLGFGLVLSGCGKAPQVMSAEFSSMDDCLAAIQRNTGEKLDIVSNEFGEVSGFLKGTKLGFGCKTESTGTKGLIVNGWYQVEG
ncbi:hypothetical protein N5B99_00200 [Acinetobacter johnsonii]|uniref:hypothetical protein n=1 Tax=Acinetobacter TaxID=469 RepID=UPI00244B2126|nr:hypothetical protein [Acinetobacter johnsonii]MDH1239117.1 hypothetical protein [Acinetobacter johnsonii]